MPNGSAGRGTTAAVTTRPVTNRYRWVVLAAGTGSQVSFTLTLMAIPVMAPELQRQYGLDLAHIGLLFSSVNVGVVLTQLLWGALIDKVGDRVVMSLGLTGTALAVLVAALGGNLVTLFGGLVAAGALGAGANVASGRVISSWFSARERGFALGVRQSGGPLAGGLAAAILPFVLGLGGIRGALLSISGLQLIGALVAAIWLRDPARQPEAPKHESREGGLRDKRMWLLPITLWLLLLPQAGLGNFMVLFLNTDRGLSVPLAAACYGIVQVASAFMRIAAGRWSDRTGRRIVTLQRLSLAIAVTAALVAVFAQSPAFVVAPLLVVAAVVGWSWNGVAFVASVEMARPDRIGSAVALQNSLFTVAFALSSSLFGTLVAATSWQFGFLLLAPSALAASILLRPFSAAEVKRQAKQEMLTVTV